MIKQYIYIIYLNPSLYIYVLLTLIHKLFIVIQT